MIRKTKNKRKIENIVNKYIFTIFIQEQILRWNQSKIKIYSRLLATYTL
jgi:hypothetical protein